MPPVTWLVVVDNHRGWHTQVRFLKVSQVHHVVQDQIGMASQLNSHPHSKSQEEKRNNVGHSAYASLETMSPIQFRSAPVKATENEVGSLLKRLKAQEELAQQQHAILSIRKQ